jgi:hypothetical protein
MGYWKLLCVKHEPLRQISKQVSNGGVLKTFEVMTSISPLGTLGSVASLLTAIIHQ